MAKVFTIATGLENMGALKSGGQGSVYKGRRIGEIITAIKLLPTPIYSESENDKNYRDFQNEVQKLKKVNEEPNPNVVKILSSGLSETGNFPFIEMEYIEGPDLEELLKPPHDPVFTIKEVVRVAEQLSNALAHCHKVGVRHGDVKSNNVKYNLQTGNYVLLDFGLAIMSDEQRRTSLRRAGAVEFMAPEQNEGQMLFATDVYSFGVVLFELLAGVVPFPLEDKGETARNLVRLAHIEKPAPDVLSLRKANLPETWSVEKKEREMLVPDWLLAMIYKCLRKEPSHRFDNGMELQDFIAYNSVHSGIKINSVPPGLSQEQTERLQKENLQLQQQLLGYKEQLNKRDKELEELTLALDSKDGELRSIRQNSDFSGGSNKQKNVVSKSAFFALLLLTIGLAAFSAFTFLKDGDFLKSPVTANNAKKINPSRDTSKISINRTEKKLSSRKKDSLLQVRRINDSIKRANKNVAVKTDSAPNIRESQNADVTSGNTSAQDDQDQVSDQMAKYKAINVAYFYNQPDEATRRDGVFINKWNAPVIAQDDLNGFIYVVYTNEKKQTTRGWLLKKDLQRIK